MELKLIDLRRYAIDNRIEIKITDSGSNREVLINTRGQARIEDEDRDFRIEDVIASADRFEVIKDGKSQRMGRSEMAAAIGEAFKRRSFAGAHGDEEE